MICPKCGIEMTVTQEDISNNGKRDSGYDILLYWCKLDDTWVNYETPVVVK